jgi:Putative restriction endonuclease
MTETARREDWPRTVAEFGAWHARQPERWELIDGRPWMMAPASMKHTIIKNNVGFALRQAMADLGCSALVDGAQILTDEIWAIPDVVVTSSPP